MRWLNELSARLDVARAAAEATLTEGRASDFAEYRRLAGIIYGLKKAQELANEVSEQLMRE